MEEFYTARTADFEKWYAEFSYIYKGVSKFDLEQIFSHAYTLGALQNSREGK